MRLDLLRFSVLGHYLVDLAQRVGNLARDIGKKVHSIDAGIQSSAAIEGRLLALSQAIQDTRHFDIAFMITVVLFLADQDAVSALSCLQNTCQAISESIVCFLLDHLLDLLLIAAN